MRKKGLTKRQEEEEEEGHVQHDFMPHMENSASKCSRVFSFHSSATTEDPHFDTIFNNATNVNREEKKKKIISIIKFII